jgi:NRAMP (natural resistance-associated macrophage protein)-like metal ion transporter
MFWPNLPSLPLILLKSLVNGNIFSYIDIIVIPFFTLGSAIALNLLFPSLPLPAGVAITAADVFIILLFYNEEANDDESSSSMRMVRFFEMFVMMLVAAVSICFIIELAYSDIVAVDVLKGYIPTKEIFTQPDILYVAIGILGATIMPHNLYLHSFIVQSRCRVWKGTRPRVVEREGKYFIKSKAAISEKMEEKEQTSVSVPPEDVDFETLKHQLDTSLKQNLHYGFVDLIVALTVAFFVNCAILIVASANFYYGPDSAQQVVQDLFSAHALLMQYLGPPAAVVFALALLCAGQSSTLTATLAGQGNVVLSFILSFLKFQLSSSSCNEWLPWYDNTPMDSTHCHPLDCHCTSHGSCLCRRTIRIK